jgi:hypothetical protein
MPMANEICSIDIVFRIVRRRGDKNHGCFNPIIVERDLLQTTDWAYLGPHKQREKAEACPRTNQFLI